MQETFYRHPLICLQSFACHKFCKNDFRPRLYFSWIEKNHAPYEFNVSIARKYDKTNGKLYKITWLGWFFFSRRNQGRNETIFHKFVVWLKVFKIFIGTLKIQFLWPIVWNLHHLHFQWIIMGQLLMLQVTIVRTVCNLQMRQWYTQSFNNLNPNKSLLWEK